jgi:hypothetical protein
MKSDMDNQDSMTGQNTSDISQISGISQIFHGSIREVGIPLNAKVDPIHRFHLQQTERLLIVWLTQYLESSASAC